MLLKKRLTGYYKRLFFELNSLRSKRKHISSQLAYKKWKTTLANSSSELLIGANLDLNGGVRNHIHSIHRYTSLKSTLAPNDTVLRKFGPTLFLTNSEDFAQTPVPPKARVCHSHVSPWFIDMCYNNRERIRWIHTHHAWYHDDTSPNGLEDWQLKLNEKGLFALRNCDKPLVVSRSQQRFLKENLSVEAEYIPNGVDSRLCLQGKATRFRQRFKIHSEFLLWIGRNECVKNPSELIDAAEQLPQYTFVVAGNSCTTNELQKTRGRKLPDNIHAIGTLDRMQAQDALAACAALVVTSKREGLPTVILEAMVHRKPVITSDAEGCLDAIDGGKHGFVYPRGNVSQLCEQIQIALSQNQPNDAGFEFVIAEFDWKNVIKKLDEIYRNH
jgi:glycosyltransferase involved in cell wall biosynthesis